MSQMMLDDFIVRTPPWQRLGANVAADIRAGLTASLQQQIECFIWQPGGIEASAAHPRDPLLFADADQSVTVAERDTSVTRRPA
jgi:hypothetical protein